MAAPVRPPNPAWGQFAPGSTGMSSATPAEYALDVDQVRVWPAALISTILGRLSLTRRSHRNRPERQLLRLRHRGADHALRLVSGLGGCFVQVEPPTVLCCPP